MHSFDLKNLYGLAGLAGQAGVDIRPTLLRVLTDLYIQKPSHSAEEERLYSELALRLIDVVDAGVCAAVANRLEKYASAPPAVIARLQNILPRAIAPENEIALRSNAGLRLDEDLFEPIDTTEPGQQGAVSAKPVASTADFVEQRETFFRADRNERKLILLNLAYVATEPGPARAQGTNVLQYMEQAALAGRFQEFTTLLQQSLGLSRPLCARIIADPQGEPFLVAAKSLAMPQYAFERILLFLNPSIGQSVERVYELSDLYAELPLQSTLHLVAVWRAADRAEARTAGYIPAHWSDPHGPARTFVAHASRQLDARPASQGGQGHRERSKS